MYYIYNYLYLLFSSFLHGSTQKSHRAPTGLLAPVGELGVPSRFRGDDAGARDQGIRQGGLAMIHVGDDAQRN